MLEIAIGAVVFVVCVLVVGGGTRGLLGMRVGWPRVIAVCLIVFIPSFPVASWAAEQTGALQVDVESGDQVAAAIAVLLLAFAWLLAVSVAVLVVLEGLWPTSSFPNPFFVARSWWRRGKRTRRYLSILRIASTHGVGWLFTGRSSGGRALSSGEHNAHALVEAINESGVTFVKLGQVLSTREDIVPEPYLSALSTLQSAASTMPWEVAQGVIEAELGCPIDAVFARVDEVPLAAASVAQVHSAKLLDGTDVVIKVQRPSARAEVKADVDILLRLARRAEVHTRQGREMRAEAIAQGFTKTLLDELDYRLEARNTEMIRSTLALIGEHEGEPVPVSVPSIYPQASTNRMITMDRVDGVPLSEAGARLAHLSSPERDRLAVALMNTALEQMLVHGVFHADLHPGNVILRHDDSLALIDFGAVGLIERSKREQVAALLLAAASEDDISATEALLLIVDAPRDADTEALRHDLGIMLTAVRHQAQADASIFTLALAIAREHRLALPAGLASMFRSFATLEGCLRVLVPDFSFVDRALERVPALMRRMTSLPHLAASVHAQTAVLGALARRLPRRLESITSQLERGELGFRHESFAASSDRAFLRGLFSELVGIVISLTVGVVAVALVVGGGGPNVAPHLTLFQLGGAALGLVGFLGILRGMLRASRVGRSR